MDLSNNRINKIQQNNPNFCGMKGAYSSNNTPVFEFLAPPHSSDENVELDLTFLERDPKTGSIIKPKKDAKHYIYQYSKDGRPIVLSQQKVRGFSPVFAYTYRITPKQGDVRYASDGFRTIKSEDGSMTYDLIDQGFDYGITPKMGTMYHGFMDTYAILDENGELKTYDGSQRCHFNQLGGTSEGIIYAVNNTDMLDSNTYYMSNPDIGNDEISSHKYWPQNQYRCSDLNNLKRLITALYKKGIGYVADGAFTSHGINSPVFQHILKWGSDSPHYKMLKIDSERPTVGILPIQSPDDAFDVYEHIGVRLVNPDGKDYDKDRYSYIQFFDDRLLSEEKQHDSKHIYLKNDKHPDNPLEILNDNDSVQLYPFPVNPKDKKIKEVFKNGNVVKLNEIKDLGDFLRFEKYSIGRKNEVSGLACWDGNVDIIKNNFNNPDLRKLILGVGAYWTELAQRELIHQTALMSDDEKRQTAYANKISPAKYEELLALNSQNELLLPVLIQDKKAQDYVKEFPIPSLELSSELSAIVLEPQFASEFYADGVFEKISKIVDETITAAIPQQYKNNDEYKTYALKIYAPDVIKNILAGAICPDAILADGTIDLEKLESIQLKTMTKNPLTCDEERQQVIKKIKAGLSEESAYKLKGKIASELSQISLENFKLSEAVVVQGKAGLNWRYDASKDVGDLESVRSGNKTPNNAWTGDEQTPGSQDFWTNFNKGVRKYNLASYVINEVTSLGEFCPWDDKEKMEDFNPRLTKELYDLPEDQFGQYELHPAYQQEVNYISTTSSTTSSSFDKHFNRTMKYAGVDIEGGMNIADSAGDISQIRQNMADLMRFDSPNSAMLKHYFDGNHDKPRPLHGIPLDMNLFYTDNLNDSNIFYRELAKDVTGGLTDFSQISGKAVAVGSIMMDEIQNRFTTPNQRDKMLKTLQSFVNGSTVNGKPNKRKSDEFATLPYENSMYHMVKEAGLFKDNAQIWQMQGEMLKEAMEVQDALDQTNVALIGVPTLFNGGEYGQTGYERESKNPHLGIRNQVLHELQNDPYHKEHYKKNRAIQNIHRLEGMSAVREGYPINLKTSKPFVEVDENQAIKPIKVKNAAQFDYFKEKINAFLKTSGRQGGAQMDTALLFKILDKKLKEDPETFKKLVCDKEGFNIAQEEFSGFVNNYKALKQFYTQLDEDSLGLYPKFAYDENGSRVIVVASNNGTLRKKVSGDVKFAVKNPRKNYKISAIPIVDDNDRCPLEEGTTLKRKVYSSKKGFYVDDKEEYTVKNGKIVSKSGKILVDDTTSFFYVPKSENKKAQYMSYLYNQAN